MREQRRHRAALEHHHDLAVLEQQAVAVADEPVPRREEGPLGDVGHVESHPQQHVVEEQQSCTSANAGAEAPSACARRSSSSAVRSRNISR